MAFEEVSMINERPELAYSAEKPVKPAPIDESRFRVLGRTQIVGRNQGGSIISKEGQEIAQELDHIQEMHRQAKQEEQ